MMAIVSEYSVKDSRKPFDGCLTLPLLWNPFVAIADGHKKLKTTRQRTVRSNTYTNEQTLRSSFLPRLVQDA